MSGDAVASRHGAKEERKVMSEKERYGLTEFISTLGTHEACREYLVQQRWQKVIFTRDAEQGLCGA